MKTKSTLAPRLRLDTKVNYVSDDDYLEDLGDSLAVSSTRHLERLAELSYNTGVWDFLGRVQDFQTLDDSIPTEARPYSRLPQLRLDSFEIHGPGGTVVRLFSEYVHFYRDEGIRGHDADDPGADGGWSAAWPH